ncbi:MAG: hypothetical protein JRM75_04505, partial [Nitrososphaerota archaeon]|nr:hypothetical protein [Nitrososphaerota archaeon]
MVPLIVYAFLIATIVISFWSSLVEATYLTLRPFSLSATIDDPAANASKALAIARGRSSSNWRMTSSRSLMPDSGPPRWLDSSVVLL